MERLLAKIALFRGLPAASLKPVGDAVEVRRFRKGAVLFKEGQPANEVWLIHRGWVHLVKHAVQDAQATICTVTPEEVLCGFSAVVGHARYYASAVAATETTALRVPRQMFVRLLTHQPGFAERVLALYHTRMRNMAEAIALAQAPVAQRLAYTLLRLRRSFGTTIPVTHQELSRMAGTRWETSIRTLAMMKRKHWVTSSRGKVTIVAPQRLRELLTVGPSSNGKL